MKDEKTFRIVEKSNIVDNAKCMLLYYNKITLVMSKHCEICILSL